MAPLEDVTIENDLREMIARITELDADKITMEANFVDDLGMDSMMALEILAGMEKKFKIQIPEEKLGQLKNLRDTIELTKAYLL